MSDANDSNTGTGPSGARGHGTKRFWLRFSDHDVELPPGEVVIGRSPRCQLVIEDPMISRQHARLVVSDSGVTIEDLGSVNGVLVNGSALTGVRHLSSGDRIVIGQQAFSLHVAQVDASAARDRLGRMTLSQPGRETMRFSLANELGSAMAEPERSEATRQSDAFEMLTGVVEKVLALGRGDEAERILGNYLRSLLQAARVQNRADPATAERAASYALRIAEATGKGGWADYAFELYGILAQPLPAHLVDRLYETSRSMNGVNLGVFRRYLGVLRSAEAGFGPSERFLVRRLFGLEQLLQK